MSNQEAALYRLNAFQTQAAFAENAAANQAQSTAGTVRQLANTFDDYARSLLNAAGPVAPIIGGLSQMSLQAGLALGGFIKLGQGLRDFTSASGGVRAAVSGLLTGLGPGGLLAVGLGAATIGAIALYKAFNDDLPNAFSIASGQIDDVDTALKNLVSTMDDVSLALQLQAGQAQFDSLINTLGDYKTALDNATARPDEVFTPVLDPSQGKAQVDALNEQKDLLKEVEAAFGSTAEAEKEYGEAQQALIAIYSSTEAGAKGAQESIANLFATFEASSKTPADFKALLDGILYTLADLPNYTRDVLEAQKANEDLAASFDTLQTALFSTTTALADLIRSGANDSVISGFKDDIDIFSTALTTMYQSLDSDALKAFQDDWLSVTTYAGAAADDVQARIHDLTIALMAGVISPEEYAAAIKTLHAELGALDDQATVTGDVLTQMGGHIDELIGHMQRLNIEGQRAGTGIGSVVEVIQANVVGMSTRAEEEQRRLLQSLGATHGAWEAQSDAVARNADIVRFQSGEYERGVSSLEQYKTQLEATNDALGVLATTAQQLQAGGLDTPAINIGVNLEGGQNALDNVFRTIVGNTNALSQQMGGVKSWADELIGDPGTWAELDDLLAEGRINQEQWNAAQEAQVRISTDVTNAQRDLLAIQANLAPTIADATREQAEYIDSLQDADTQTQLAALGYMDQAESMKALELAQLAAASTTDEMKESTASMIEQAAAADPVLKAMLQDMGLLDANGKAVLTVDDSQAKQAQKTTEQLNYVLSRLTLVLSNAFDIDVDDSDVGPAQSAVDNLITSLGILDNSDANPSVTVNDNATGTILSIAGQLLALDGQRSTVYIDRITTDINQKVGPTGANGLTMHAYANGGTMDDWIRLPIPAYANGGLHGGGMALVGEVGPEMVWLPNGSQVTPAPATKSRLKDMDLGGGGDVNFYGPVTLQPAADNTYAAIRRSALASSRR